MSTVVGGDAGSCWVVGVENGTEHECGGRRNGKCLHNVKGLR